MNTCCDIGEGTTIEIQAGGVISEVHVATNIYDLGFGLLGILMDTEADVMLGCVLFTDLQHPGHSTAGG